VVYPVSMVGGRLGALLLLNPMTPIVEAYRDVLLRGRPPDGPMFAVLSVVSLLTLALAWLRFHRAEFEFAENV
jgi:ABC-type polysaccharide/polyol phosphate export permease